ncbi:MAG: 3-oxoacyl-ACP reductase family protein [Rhizomicrobium sp.]|jgi:acetoacetyl-CoA reductase/3-oxoacyl-[acyl-carrier protein] reductase
MSRFSLTGKNAVVTGGSRGIGRAIALGLAEAGADVVLTFHEQRSEAEKVVKQIEAMGGRARALRMDVCSRKSIKSMVAAAKKHFRRPLDIVVNNAAIADERPMETITDAAWDRMLATNLRGPFAVCQETLPGMIESRWGRVVNIVSIGGQWGGTRQVHYAASKAALINFTQSLARLYSGYGITSNAVSPGLVATDMAQKELRSKAGKRKAAQIPLGRIADAKEIADTVAFLCSEEAGYITGQTLNVNGGMYFG